MRMIPGTGLWYLCEQLLNTVMSIWNKIFKRSILDNPSVNLNDPATYEMLTSGPPSSSGVRVSLQSVLGNPAVRRACELISTKVAILPLNVMRYGNNGSREKDNQHPAQKLLRRSPSPLYTPFVFRRTMQLYCLLYGNAWAYIVRDAYALPVELLILDPTATYIDTSTGLPLIRTNLNDKPFTLATEDCLHIQNIGDGVEGYNTLQLGRDALGLGLSLQRHAAYYFANNAQPKLIVELPPTIKGLEKVTEFRNAWYRSHANVENTFKPAFVPTGTKTTTVAINNDEGQFNQSREFDLISSANLFGSSHSKIGSAQNTSYGSLEQDDKNFLADSIEHHLINWEEECQTKLLTEQEKEEESHYIEFERKKLISTDIKTEIELLGYQFQNGMISWQEMRQKLNMTTDKSEDETWQHPSNIVIEGEEPEPQPMPQMLPQAPAEEPVEEEAEEVARKLTEQTVSRLLKRISKAVSEGQTDLTKHRDIVIENMSAFKKGKEIAERMLDNMQHELSATLPEQHQAVLARYTTEQIVEELWK